MSKIIFSAKPSTYLQIWIRLCLHAQNWKPSLLNGLLMFFLGLEKFTTMTMTFVDKKEGPAWNKQESSYPSDVDECSLNTHDCHSHAICTNTEGSFTCKCDVNAHYIGDGKTCTPHRKPNYMFYFILFSSFYHPDIC